MSVMYLLVDVIICMESLLYVVLLDLVVFMCR